MAYTGKATYSAGATLPEIVEDVSDLVAISSPHETPLLDALGDAVRPARSTVHEWLEDTLLANTDVIDDEGISNGLTDTTFQVATPSSFRVGDQIRVDGQSEIMLVTAINTTTAHLTVTRNYGGTTGYSISDEDNLQILGNAALEGDQADAARFTSRSRKTNYTQIFTGTVEVSGSELAVRQVGVADELDYQKQQRTRELLRDLENCVINGRAPVTNQQGSWTIRRTMQGILGFISTHKYAPGVSGFPAGTAVTEEQLNHALRSIWSQSAGNVDLIVVGGKEKRAINNFVGSNRRFTAEDQTFKSQIAVYESDFGVCRVILSRWVPSGTVLLLDSSRIEVLPLAGRSFHYKPLASTGDRETGQVIGEYTLEFRNESAHGMISGYTT